MTRSNGGCPFGSRRAFLGAAGGLAGALGAGVAMAASEPEQAAGATEPFWGARQGGILTPTQAHTCFAAFDVQARQASEVAALLRRWTEAAARLAAGGPATSPADGPDGDSGEAIGLPPARLTLTFGFGATLFESEGRDRFGLAASRPEALVDMPAFNGDQLVAARTGGDLSVQACADDPRVAFHAVRQLARLAQDAARVRWMQAGFAAATAGEGTPRNLMGFKDGTRNQRAPEMLWVGEEGPEWMRGGSYVVARRIRVSLEHWDRTPTPFQEQVIGRAKRSGAPLGSRDEFDPMALDATDADGNPVIPEDAHVRLAAPELHEGAAMLRRGYAYNDGASFTAERWPPWRQGMLFDAGLLFIAYQRDPRRGFIRIFDAMSKLDALNQFTTHTGSGLFACPAGARPGGFIGEALFGQG